jgi:hypothetical protein
MDYYGSNQYATKGKTNNPPSQLFDTNGPRHLQAQSRFPHSLPLPALLQSLGCEFDQSTQHLLSSQGALESGNFPCYEQLPLQSNYGLGCSSTSSHLGYHYETPDMNNAIIDRTLGFPEIGDTTAGFIPDAIMYDAPDDALDGLYDVQFNNLPIIQQPQVGETALPSLTYSQTGPFSTMGGIEPDMGNTLLPMLMEYDPELQNELERRNTVLDSNRHLPAVNEGLIARGTINETISPSVAEAQLVPQRQLKCKPTEDSMTLTEYTKTLVQGFDDKEGSWLINSVDVGPTTLFSRTLPRKAPRKPFRQRTENEKAIGRCLECRRTKKRVRTFYQRSQCLKLTRIV